MPGFNVCGFGYQGFGGQPSNVLEPRRVHRWVFTTIGRGLGVFQQRELLVLKTATRPQFKFEDVKMEHNQETVHFAGKQSWELVELTWYDIEQDPDISRGVYQWLETVVEIKTANVNHPRNYKRNATLAIIDGTGQITESWNMCGTYPESIDWGKLDYGTSDILTVSAKMRYDRAMRQCLTIQPRLILPTCPVG
jgi:hypothetical protein